MKYKKGSIVEVFVQDEVSYHSWRCAKIVTANGHNYTVNYHVYPGFTNQDDVEHVSAKFIRPCPPLLEISELWVSGDVVEVLHNLSWKMAVVLKDCGWEQFVVRLVGSFHEFEVNKSELRVRQSYENGQWIVIGKVVDAANNKENINQTKLQNNNTDCVSVMSSSGSCSINSYNSYEMYSGSGFHDSDAESVCQSEYCEESSGQSAASEPPVDEIHELELEAYRSTMVALHASGPLNWEKELMVTNLRMLLHISKDEHLIMLKYLISSSSSNSCSR